MTNLSCSMHVCFCNICTWTHSLYNCRRTYWQIKPKQRKPWSKPHLSQMLHMHVDIESGQTNILANDKETQTWKGWSLWKEHMVWFLMVLLYVSWWLTYPSEKYEFVSWDYNIPSIWKNKTCSKPPTSICLLMLACYWPLTRLSIFLKFCGHLPCQQHHLKDFREKPPEIHSPDIQGYPLVNFHIWKITIEIVSFPMKNGGSFHRFLLDYQRLSTDIPPKDHIGQVVLEVTAMIIHRLPISQRSSSPNRHFLYNG